MMARKKAQPKKTTDKPVEQDVIVPALRLYRTTGIVRLYSGQIALTEQQAQVRSERLCPAGDGLYSIQAPIEFIAGEVLGFIEDPPPSILSLLESVDG